MPREIGGLLWFGVDDTYFTVYVPMYASMTKTPYNFQKGLGSLAEFTWDSAFWVFNFVSNYSYPKFSIVIDDVQKVQHDLEGKFLARQNSIEEAALSLYKESPRKAVDYLTDYSIEMADITVKRWKKLGEDLILKYMDGIKKNEFFKPVNIGYSEQMKQQIVKESGNKLKVKELPGSAEIRYSNYIAAADEHLSNKNYADAKKIYENALKVKPDDLYAKEKISVIDKVLKQIDELHESIILNGSKGN